MSTELVLHGERITSLDAFYQEISLMLLRGADSGCNLDALDDILSGRFGAPEPPYVIRWRDSGLSARYLGYPETVRFLERKLSRCHPSSRAKVALELELARRSEGPTIFDLLIEVIESHRLAEDGQPKITLYLD